MVAGGERGGAAFGAAAGARRGRLTGATAPPGSGPMDSTPTGAITHGWVHGYWNGHGDAAWGWHNGYWGGWGWGGMGGWGWGLGMGMGLGFGLASWGFGSALYGMGYMPYYNPYYGYGGGARSSISRSWPCPTTTRSRSTPPSRPRRRRSPTRRWRPSTPRRASFKQGNYDQALAQTDAALKTLPSDTALHEFRALCLFALTRYDEAAATLYAVLSVGPGWDWATLVGLYPDVDVYTAQLRALEAYCDANTDRGPAAVRAGLSLPDRRATPRRRRPCSSRSSRSCPATPSRPSWPASSSRPRTRPRPRDAGHRRAIDRPGRHGPAPGRVDRRDLEGAAGRRHRDRPDDPARRAASPGRSPRRARRSSSPGPRPTATASSPWSRSKGPALVGRVSWKDAGHMTFRVVGDGPDDPGLSFSK